MRINRKGRNSNAVVAGNDNDSESEGEVKIE